MVGTGSGGLCSRALLPVEVLCSCLGLWIRCLWKMFFSVVVLVLTKALVAGKFTLVTLIETHLHKKVSGRPSSHVEASHFGIIVKL